MTIIFRLQRHVLFFKSIRLAIKVTPKRVLIFLMLHLFPWLKIYTYTVMAVNTYSLGSDLAVNYYGLNASIWKFKKLHASVSKIVTYISFQFYQQIKKFYNLEENLYWSHIWGYSLLALIKNKFLVILKNGLTKRVLKWP